MTIYYLPAVFVWFLSALFTAAGIMFAFSAWQRCMQADFIISACWLIAAAIVFLIAFVGCYAGWVIWTEGV